MDLAATAASLLGAPRSKNRIRPLWDRIHGLPGGRLVFTRALCRMVPYSGTIRPVVLELSPGHAKVAVRDRKQLRNHLDCIHAAALANLGELATGLAVNYSLPDRARGIATSLATEYVKKARGTIVATCDAELPDGREDREVDVEAVLRDGLGEVVARTRARWRIGPRR